MTISVTAANGSEHSAKRDKRVAEAARATGISEASLRHAIHSGRLPVTRRGYMVFVSLAEIHDLYLAER